jgi:hypothetical protein
MVVGLSSVEESSLGSTPLSLSEVRSEQRSLSEQRLALSGMWLDSGRGLRIGCSVLLLILEPDSLSNLDLERVTAIVILAMKAEVTLMSFERRF